MVYLGDFYWFPNFCKFQKKIARFLGKKHPFFANTANIWDKNNEKFMNFLKKGPIDTIVGILESPWNGLHGIVKKKNNLKKSA